MGVTRREQQSSGIGRGTRFMRAKAEAKKWAGAAAASRREGG
jgi:hypothetical protein